jgi:hypothetical protein
VKRSTQWALAALFVLVALAAVAGVAKGGTLYIKGQDVKLLSKPDLKSSGSKLKAGDPVVWNGPSDKNPQLQDVKAGSKKGFVIQSALATAKPIDEIPKSDGKPVSAEAFKSSGAATKAMTEAGLKYAAGTPPKEGSPAANEVAAGIIHMEGSSEDEKTKVKDLVKKNGLDGAK